VVMKTVERYDVERDEWKELRMQLNYGRAFCSAITFNNRYIYLVGGTTDTECIEIYDTYKEDE
jgi:N-acetylneuraminic acid mutarotase